MHQVQKLWRHTREELGHWVEPWQRTMSRLFKTLWPGWGDSLTLTISLSFGEFSASLTCLNVSFLGNYCPICFKCYEDNDYDSQMMQCGTCNHWVHAKCEDLTGDFYYWLCKHWWHTVLKLLNTGTALPNLNVICYCQLSMKVFLRLHLWILIMSRFHPKYLSCKIISDELYEILSSLPESVVYSCRPCSVTQPSAWRELLYIELRAGVEKVLACLLSSTLTQHLVTCSQVGDFASIFISDALIDLPGTGIRWFSVFSTPTGDQLFTLIYVQLWAGPFRACTTCTSAHAPTHSHMLTCCKWSLLK